MKTSGDLKAPTFAQRIEFRICYALGTLVEKASSWFIRMRPSSRQPG